MLHFVALALSCMLPVVSLALLYGIAGSLLATAHRPSDWRHALLLGSAVGATLVVAITEGLSLVSRFQRGWVLAAWIAVVAGAAFHRVRLRALRPPAGGAVPSPRAPRWSALDSVMLVTIGLYCALLAIVAISYPPNNYDSMTYHMARVAHWIQAQSVAFYPTGVMMQVRGAPFAEYAIAHLQLLARGDRLANLVQWYAMVVSAVGASAIAAEFGATRRRQIAAALFTISLPMGILQATSTQNDYVVAAWMVCFVVFALRFALEPQSWPHVVAMGLSLGLAVLTKQTALAYASGFCIVVSVVAFLRLRSRAVPAGAAVCAIVLVMNAGFVLRTQRVYGAPLGPRAGLTNEIHSVRAVSSNAIRNLAINFTSSTGIGAVDSFAAWMMNILRSLHALTNLSPVDPRTTLTTSEDPFATRARMHEDLAGNLVHSVLAMLALAAAAFAVVRRPGAGARDGWLRVPPMAAYAACLLVGALFFCYQFKWQVWGTRLQLSLFVLASPLIATTLFRASDRLIGVVATLVGVLGLAWVQGNATRPFNSSLLTGRLDRTAWYFVNRPDLLPTFGALTDAVAASACRRIGLRISADPFEYPLWVLLDQRGVHPRLKHVEAHGYVPIAPDPQFEPCAVISAGTDARYSAAPARRVGGFVLYSLGSSIP